MDVPRIPRRFRFASWAGEYSFGVFVPGPPGYNGQAIGYAAGVVSCQEHEAPGYFPGFAWIDPPAEAVEEEADHE